MAAGSTAIAVVVFFGSEPSEEDVAGSTAQSQARAGSQAPTVETPIGNDPEPTPSATPMPFVWPADGRITQGITSTHPAGIDIAVDAGKPVVAVRGGKVAFVGGDPCCAYGYFITVRHDDGWLSLYGHLSAFATAAGERVSQGQLLGYSGGTGKVTGPHLHLELRRSGRTMDPLAYLPDDGREIAPDAFVAAAPADGPTSQGEAPPPGSEGPPATPTSQGEAVALAIEWMGRPRGELVYTIDAASCNAVRSGINWLVACRGTAQGCLGALCQSTLTACVFEQPRFLVTDACP